MLYILPPPSAPSPPSPWNSILCSGSSSSVAQRSTRRPPTRGKANLHLRGTGKKKESVAGVPLSDDDVSRSLNKGLSECYFAGKGSAVVLPGPGPGLERLRTSTRRPSINNSRESVVATGCDIQYHLQSMFYLLRPEDTLKMAVKLESARTGRTRYLVVVSCPGGRLLAPSMDPDESSPLPTAPLPSGPPGDGNPCPGNALPVTNHTTVTPPESPHPSTVLSGCDSGEESCLLGIDCNEKTTVGLVLRVLADTAITLDGDGGFKVSVCGCQHIFKPVSVQAMWSALQTLHKVSSKAREQNYFQGGLSHEWVSYYEHRIESERSCLNEWHAMDNIESRRPPSPDSVRNKPRERGETERVIRATLKEIMMSVDLDEVTSKYIRGRLEEDLDMDLGEFKPFIDQEMLTILGQMDSPTEIFDHVYLGSEWNASNLEELQKNGVRHILNVTREIDNFFPGMFDYLNVRVYDDEKTDLLKHWDNTFKYISRAKREGSKVLVHCKMGVSRSASVVIAYAMKAFNWDFDKAIQHVKTKRNCIKPNTSFLSQLETYQGILDAMKNKEKLQRSKSETNLKSPGMVAKTERRVLAGSEPTPLIQALGRHLLQTTASGHDLRLLGSRPKSWSPDTVVTKLLLSSTNSAPTSLSLEDINRDAVSATGLSVAQTENTAMNQVESQPNMTPGDEETEARNVLMPCDGKVYSVSQNQIVHLPSSQDKESHVKNIVNELESQSAGSGDRQAINDRKGLVLNLANQFESVPDKHINDSEPVVNAEQHIAQVQTKLAPQMLTAVIVKKEIWDPGEKETNNTCDNSVSPSNQCDSFINNSDSPVWTSSTQLFVNKNNIQEDVKLDSVNESDDKIYSSRTELGAIGNGNKTLPRVGDPFSAQLDRVFDREERKQQRNNVVITEPEQLLPSVTEQSSDITERESPSRQSSWSSFDSAVVLGYQGEPREAPSRNSSWGPGDTRALPSRNSSFGSYDMRPVDETTEELLTSTSSGMFPYDKDDIPWHPGTVKRTKQKLEQGVGATASKRVCSEDNTGEPPVVSNLNLRVHCPRPYQNPALVEAVNGALIRQVECAPFNTSERMKKPVPYPRLSMSAPEMSSMPLLDVATVKRSCSSGSNISKLCCTPLRSFKSYSGSAHTQPIRVPKRCMSVDETTPTSKSNESDCSKNLSGLVKNLKLEFEAKSVMIENKSMEVNLNEKDAKSKIKVQSLPSSPVSAHVEIQTKNEITSDLEDLSVKVLVGKYEISKTNTSALKKNKPRSLFENKQHANQQPIPSCKNDTSPQPPLLIKHSSVFTGTKGVDRGEFKRPPVPPTVRCSLGGMAMPSVVVASVVAKAASKKQLQHGKTHPLTRLSVNKPQQRHTNSMYNTM